MKFKLKLKLTTMFVMVLLVSYVVLMLVVMGISGEVTGFGDEEMFG